MAEQGVREIPLSGKQLVFLFMASVVLVVVVFLLGVSVGRGARAAAPSASAAAAPAQPEGAMSAPPGTTTSPAQLTYQNELRNGAGAPKPTDTTVQVAAPVSQPAAGSTGTSPPASTTEKAPKPTTSFTAAPASRSESASTAAKPPVAPAGSWFVQVESFRSKELADALVAKLKAKGYDAFIVDVPRPLLRVRVGPFADRSQAEGKQSQLKKDGFSSLVTR